MSLPLNRTISLRVQHHRIDASLHQGWPRRAITAKSHALIHGGMNLSQALDAALTRLLDGLHGQKPRLCVDLSDDMVFLDVVAGAFAHFTPDQVEAMAMACVQDIVADASDHYIVRWQLQADLQHLLLCAVPRELLRTVEQAAQAHRLSLLSVQPEFCTAWNQHARLFGNTEGVFAMLGAHCTMALLTPKGTITAISSTTVTTPSPNESTADANADTAPDLRTLQPLLEQQLQRMAPAANTADPERFQRILITHAPLGNSEAVGSGADASSTPPNPANDTPHTVWVALSGAP